MGRARDIARQPIVWQFVEKFSPLDPLASPNDVAVSTPTALGPWCPSDGAVSIASMRINMVTTAVPSVRAADDRAPHLHP